MHVPVEVANAMVDLKRIRHFVVLAETLNFRRAAERLHMAQPPLSVSIQRLEADLGTRLFVRAPTGVTLSPSGEAALPEARKALFHAEQFELAARSALDGTGGLLRIGFVGSSTHGMLQRLVSEFRLEYPGVELFLSDHTTLRIVQGIEEEVFDVGIVRTPILRSTSARLVPLQRDEFVAALPRGNPLAVKPVLELSDLAGEPFIMYSQDEAPGLYAAAMLACEQSGFVPRVVQEAQQVHTMLALVDSGLGVTLLPSVMQQRFSNDSIVFRKLANRPAAAEIGVALLYPPERETPAAERFRRLASRLFPLE